MGLLLLLSLSASLQLSSSSSLLLSTDCCKSFKSPTISLEKEKDEETLLFLVLVLSHLNRGCTLPSIVSISLFGSILWSFFTGSTLMLKLAFRKDAKVSSNVDS